MHSITLFPITGLPEITQGADLRSLLLEALNRLELTLQPGDLLVCAHKIISKSEGRCVQLSQVQPSQKAIRLAAETGKSAQLVQLVLEESSELLEVRRGILMCRHRLGWTCANAGVDLSNGPKNGYAVLLPLDPDASAQRLGESLEQAVGFPVPVLISDTHGRPLREGICGVCIGCWGLQPVKSYIGLQDRSGKQLAVSREAVADELAGAATLCMGQGNESIPAVLIRGYQFQTQKEGGCTPLKRDPQRELFVPRQD